MTPRRILLRQNPLNQGMGFSFGHLGIGRHRYRTPDAATALQDLLNQLVLSILLAGIFGGHILEARTNYLVSHRMAGHAILCFRQVGICHGGIRCQRAGGKADEQQSFHSILLDIHIGYCCGATLSHDPYRLVDRYSV